MKYKSSSKMLKKHKKGMLAIEYIICKLIACLNHMCKRVEGCRVRSTCHLMHSTHMCKWMMNALWTTTAQRLRSLDSYSRASHTWRNAAQHCRRLLQPTVLSCHVLHNSCNTLSCDWMNN